MTDTQKTETTGSASTASSTGSENTTASSPRGREAGSRLIGKPFFRRKKNCPFSGPRSNDIDYKDTRTLSRFVSSYGKMLPSHITGVCSSKQRELATAVKRARHLALLPYSSSS